MKPLYKFKKNKTKKKEIKENIITPPSLPHPSSNTRTGVLAKVEMRRTPYLTQGAHVRRTLVTTTPKMKHCGWTASGGEAETTALIALISKDNKTSVLLLKRFRTR